MTIYLRIILLLITSKRFHSEIGQIFFQVHQTIAENRSIRNSMECFIKHTRTYIRL